MNCSTASRTAASSKRPRKAAGPDNVKLQNVNCHKKRQNLLSELRSVPSIVKIAKTLNQDSVYKLVAHPDGAKLYKDSAGHIKGVFYKEGKILEHAKFKIVKSSLIKVSNLLTHLHYHHVFSREPT